VQWHAEVLDSKCDLKIGLQTSDEMKTAEEPTTTSRPGQQGELDVGARLVVVTRVIRMSRSGKQKLPGLKFL
jgi:hypothetical protein